MKSHVNPKYLLKGAPKPLSLDRQLQNCILALVYWSKVRPSSVELGDWVCGTQACFGGHLTYWKAFKEMGVQTDAVGKAPSIYYLANREHLRLPGSYEVEEGLYGMNAAAVAEYLFGTSTVFHAQGISERAMALQGGATYNSVDHRIVINRLERQISALSTRIEWEK